MHFKNIMKRLLWVRIRIDNSFIYDAVPLALYIYILSLTLSTKGHPKFIEEMKKISEEAKKFSEETKKISEQQKKIKRAKGNEQ